MLSSHVKISPLLWLYNKQHLSDQKNYLSKTVWHFIGVYIINKTLHGRLEIWNFSSCVEKNISPIRSLVKYFSTLEEKFCISVWPWNILYFWTTFRIFFKASSTGFVPFFEQKLQGLFKDFQGHISHFSRTPIQCKKEPWVYVFFSSTTPWAILSWRSFILGTWEFGLDKVSTKIQGLSSTDCNFQGLSRPWTFYFKFQGLSRTFKVHANPGSSLLSIILK